MSVVEKKMRSDENRFLTEIRTERTGIPRSRVLAQQKPTSEESVNGTRCEVLAQRR